MFFTLRRMKNVFLILLFVSISVYPFLFRFKLKWHLLKHWLVNLLMAWSIIRMMSKQRRGLIWTASKLLKLVLINLSACFTLLLNRKLRVIVLCIWLSSKPHFCLEVGLKNQNFQIEVHRDIYMKYQS